MQEIVETEIIENLFISFELLYNDGPMSWKCFDNLIHAQFRAAIFFYDIIGSCTQVSRWRDYVIKHLATHGET